VASDGAWIVEFLSSVQQISISCHPTKINVFVAIHMQLYLSIANSSGQAAATRAPLRAFSQGAAVTSQRNPAGGQAWLWQTSLHPSAA
jgi:hypothetical protein